MTTPYYTDNHVTLWHGDCLDVLRGLPDASVDAVVTDPPYNLSFMAKPWDALDGTEDAGFAYWLAGLIDGEGHFAIKKHTRGTHAPYFTLKMRADESGTLNMIRRKFGHGTITRDVEQGAGEFVHVARCARGVPPGVAALRGQRGGRVEGKDGVDSDRVRLLNAFPPVGEDGIACGDDCEFTPRPDALGGLDEDALTDVALATLRRGAARDDEGERAHRSPRGGRAYLTGSEVVLTTAHLDHTPENCDPANLRAMCQGCHLHYDRDHHARTTRRQRAIAETAQMAPLFDLVGPACRADSESESWDGVHHGRRTIRTGAEGRTHSRTIRTGAEGRTHSLQLQVADSRSRALQGGGHPRGASTVGLSGVEAGRGAWATKADLPEPTARRARRGLTRGSTCKKNRPGWQPRAGFELPSSTLRWQAARRTRTPNLKSRLPL